MEMTKTSHLPYAKVLREFREISGPVHTQRHVSSSVLSAQQYLRHLLVWVTCVCPLQVKARDWAGYSSVLKMPLHPASSSQTL